MASPIVREILGLKSQASGQFWTGFGKLGLKASPPCQGGFRVKVSGFWIGLGKSGLKASPLVRKVSGLKFEACWSGFGRKILTIFS